MITRGYQKVKWHKVSEGDFPKSGSRVLACYIKNGYKLYDICYYEYFTKNKFSILFEDITYDIDVIAWMEIPKYKE